MTFEYIVKPRIPMRGLPPEKTIIKPSLVCIEKEDVLTYLRFGNVYRKFNQDDIIKVERDNIDKLHVPATEYFNSSAGKSIKVDPSVDNGVVSNINIPETVIDNTKEELPPVEETKIEKESEKQPTKDPIETAENASVTEAGTAIDNAKDGAPVDENLLDEKDNGDPTQDAPIETAENASVTEAENVESDAVEASDGVVSEPEKVSEEVENSVGEEISEDPSEETENAEEAPVEENSEDDSVEAPQINRSKKHKRH